MQQLRLMGLALFITAIFLAMAAAITKTTHIRFQTEAANTESPVTPLEGPLNGGLVFPPASEPRWDDGNSPTHLNPVAFTAVPIIWPLIITGGLGLLMWFGVRSKE